MSEQMAENVSRQVDLLKQIAESVLATRPPRASTGETMTLGRMGRLMGPCAGDPSRRELAACPEVAGVRHLARVLFSAQDFTHATLDAVADAVAAAKGVGQGEAMALPLADVASCLRAIRSREELAEKVLLALAGAGRSSVEDGFYAVLTADAFLAALARPPVPEKVAALLKKIADDSAYAC